MKLQRAASNRHPGEQGFFLVVVMLILATIMLIYVATNHRRTVSISGKAMVSIFRQRFSTGEAAAGLGLRGLADQTPAPTKMVTSFTNPRSGVGQRPAEPR